MEQERKRGAAEAARQLKKISPDLVGRKIDPRDVKVLFDPVRYVIFRGLCDDDVKAIELVDDEPTTSTREKLVSSIDRAITKGNVEWATWRVNAAGTIVCENR